MISNLDTDRYLTEEVHYQLEKGGLVHWNWDLLKSYLLNGDCPAHHALVQEYTSTLPQVA